MWLRASAERDNAEAQSLLGPIYYHGEGAHQDYKEALKWFTTSAEQGNALAQFNLALMYNKGEGTSQDHKEALKWYTSSAEQGNALAQFKLGMMYYYGSGTPQNHVEALKWFRASAEQGDADAQYNLGVMYKQGQGTTQNDNKALKWFRASAEQEHAEAQLMLAAMGKDAKRTSQNTRTATLVREAQVLKEEDRNIRKQEGPSLLANLLGAAVVVAVGAAIYQYGKKESSGNNKSYDFSNTESMSSSSLGAELLTQKREKGIAGRGVVASYTAPSIGSQPVNNSIANVRAFSIASSNLSVCSYLSGGKVLDITKGSLSMICPLSIGLPSDGEHFNLKQMGSGLGRTLNLDLLRSADNTNYCFYDQKVQIPKAWGDSCARQINY